MTSEANSLRDTFTILDGETEIKAISYRLQVRDDLSFEICVNVEEPDDVTRAIVSGSYTFPEHFSLLQELVSPGQGVLDLGAHIGTFSLYAAALGYHVLSVEASPRNATLLRTSAARNGFSNLQVVPTAVSDRVGSCEFIQAGPYGLLACPSLDDPTITIPTTTVDALLDQVGWDQVDLIKMDIEGSEVAALLGMCNLLSRPGAPPILYESNGHTLHLHNQSTARLMALLEAHGYQCHLAECGKLFSCDSGDIQPEVCMDYLAIKEPTSLNRWQMVGTLPNEERVARILASCASAHPHTRAHIARTLLEAGGDLLAHPDLSQALDALRLDPDPQVRGAFGEGSYPNARLDARIQALLAEIADKDLEIAQLRNLVSSYERGLFIRTMRRFKELGARILPRGNNGT